MGERTDEKLLGQQIAKDMQNTWKQPNGQNMPEEDINHKISEQRYILVRDNGSLFARDELERLIASPNLRSDIIEYCNKAKSDSRLQFLANQLLGMIKGQDVSVAKWRDDFSLTRTEVFVLCFLLVQSIAEDNPSGDYALGVNELLQACGFEKLYVRDPYEASLYFAYHLRLSFEEWVPLYDMVDSMMKSSIQPHSLTEALDIEVKKGDGKTKVFTIPLRKITEFLDKYSEGKTGQNYATGSVTTVSVLQPSLIAYADKAAAEEGTAEKYFEEYLEQNSEHLRSYRYRIGYYTVKLIYARVCVAVEEYRAALMRLLQKKWDPYRADYEYGYCVRRLKRLLKLKNRFTDNSIESEMGIEKTREEIRRDLNKTEEEMSPEDYKQKFLESENHYGYLLSLEDFLEADCQLRMEGLGQDFSAFYDCADQIPTVYWLVAKLGYGTGRFPAYTKLYSDYYPFYLWLMGTEKELDIPKKRKERHEKIAQASGAERKRLQEEDAAAFRFVFKYLLNGDSREFWDKATETYYNLNEAPAQQESGEQEKLYRKERLNQLRKLPIDDAQFTEQQIQIIEAGFGYYFNHLAEPGSLRDYLDSVGLLNEAKNEQIREKRVMDDDQLYLTSIRGAYHKFDDRSGRVFFYHLLTGTADMSRKLLALLGMYALSDENYIWQMIINCGFEPHSEEKPSSFDQFVSAFCREQKDVLRRSPVLEEILDTLAQQDPTLHFINHGWDQSPKVRNRSDAVNALRATK